MIVVRNERVWLGAATCFVRSKIQLIPNRQVFICLKVRGLTLQVFVARMRRINDLIDKRGSVTTIHHDCTAVILTRLIDAGEPPRPHERPVWEIDELFLVHAAVVDDDVLKAEVSRRILCSERRKVCFGTELIAIYRNAGTVPGILRDQSVSIVIAYRRGATSK